MVIQLLRHEKENVCKICHSIQNEVREWKLFLEKIKDEGMKEFNFSAVVYERKQKRNNKFNEESGSHPFLNDVVSYMFS